MDFKFTKEQEALREEFDTFFREEMKHAPKDWGVGGFEAMFHSDEGFAFHQEIKRKLGEKGWISRAWPGAFGGQDAPLVEQLIFNEVPCLSPCAWAGCLWRRDVCTHTDGGRH